jgi:hypothetical protein
MSSRTRLALAVFLGVPAALVGVSATGGSSLLAFGAFVALMCLPAGLVAAAALAVAHVAGRRVRLSRRVSTLALATYVFAMSWTAITFALLGAWGIAFSFEDFCEYRTRDDLAVGRFGTGPELTLVPPHATCSFEVDGATVTQGYDGVLYTRLGVWLCVTLLALGTVHVVVTRLWRRTGPAAPAT